MADDSPAPTTEPTDPATQKAPPPRSLSLLAHERFGDAFKGEVKQDEAASEPEHSDTVEGGEETEPETTDAEAAEEGNEPEGTEGTEADEGGDENVVTSLTELVEQQQWDPEWVNTLRVPVKVDGKTAEATLSDLVASYQMGEAAEQRLEEAKARAKKITEDAQEQSDAVQKQFAVAAKLIEKVEAQLDSDVGAVDWKSLRDDDPAEYAAKKQEMSERRQSLEQMKRDAAQEYQQAVEQKQTETREEMQQRLQAEQAALLERLPEWRDSEKANAEKSKLAEYLTGQGFSREDVMGASDHRLVLMARKAMLYDEMKSQSDAARKKVAKVPKTLKPGTPKSQDQRSQEHVQKARQNLKTSGSIDAAYALLRAERGGR